MARLRRRPQLAALAAPVLVVLLATPALAPDDAPDQPDDDLVAEGEELFVTGCSSCHGRDGSGVEGPDGQLRGPSLRASGEASAYYYLVTGRMPLGSSEDQPVRKEPEYSDEEIEALVAYVASLGDGPERPEVDPADGDLSEGGELYRGICQACHSASGAGGALSYAGPAPNLRPASSEVIAAAVRAGPGQMPVFGPEAISDRELDSLIRYVEYLDNPADPGGLPIGRTGPIPEGFVAWLVGMVGLLLMVAWIGTRLVGRRRIS